MGRKSFQMKMKGGRPRVGADLRAAFERTQTVEKGAGIVLRAMKAETPVVKGRLKGGWAVGQGGGNWQGSTLLETVVNPTPYARRVDRTSRRNAGYIQRGIERAKQEAIEKMKVQAASIVAELWAQSDR
jgi:hypothetical protein